MDGKQQGGRDEAPSSLPIKFREGNHSAFYRALSARVDRYFSVTGRSRHASAGVVLNGVLLLGTAIAGYFAALLGGFGFWTTLAFAMVYGIAVLLLAINVGHDAAHGAFTKSRWGNHLALFGTFTLLGADPYLWRLRHVKSHHVFPNVNGCDIDIDSNAVLRLSPNHPRRRQHAYQHLYAPVVYWIVGLHTAFIQDIQYLFKQRLANLVDLKHPRWAYASFAGCKLVYLAVNFVVPLALLPFAWSLTLLGILAVSAVRSSVFIYLLIGTHFAEEADFPARAPDGAIPRDWARHAMATAVDWSPESPIAQFISGGVNAHAAHHLFPTVSHAHSIAMSRLVARTAREYGISHNVTTLPRMIRSHFRFLRRMARGSAMPAGAVARFAS